MNNLVILPIIIPLVTGILLIFLKNKVTLQKWFSAFSMITIVMVCAILIGQVFEHGIQTLEVGSWKPPYGVVFVADMFSSLLVLTTSLISLACLFFAFRTIDTDRERFYFYAFFFFLITGVNGAFLTGDIFNLFVFFEVMLMASYVLLVLGGTKVQFRETVKYILVNVISSALFVIAVGYLYGVTGTLNMADLSSRVAESGQTGLLTVIAALFFIVFGLKGAVFPLYFWLPGSYQAPPIAITALFGALLTKVGVYAIFRVFTLIFYHDSFLTQQLFGFIAVLTVIVGAIGAVAYWDVKRIIIYNIVLAIGVILFGLSSMTDTAISGSIYYLLHDMLIKATLFIFAGAIFANSGTYNIKKMGGFIKHYPTLGWMFFVAAIALVGVPPLSGFIGKLLIIKGGFEADYFWMTLIVLFSSLFVLYSMMKIFMNVFWGEQKDSTVNSSHFTKGIIYPGVFLLSISVMYGVGSEWVFPFIDQAVETLMNPSIYIESVLKE